MISATLVLSAKSARVSTPAKPHATFQNTQAVRFPGKVLACMPTSSSRHGTDIISHHRQHRHPRQHHITPHAFDHSSTYPPHYHLASRTRHSPPQCSPTQPNPTQRLADQTIERRWRSSKTPTTTSDPPSAKRHPPNAVRQTPSAKRHTPYANRQPPNERTNERTNERPK